MMCELCGKGEGELEVGGEGWCVDEEEGVL